VRWELKGMEVANVVAFYFVPGSVSRITLLEFGKYCHSGKAIVCCPKGFDRKGNVDVVCDYYKTPQVDTLEELAEACMLTYPSVNHYWYKYEEILIQRKGYVHE
jgi:hypothetical protein